MKFLLLTLLSTLACVAANLREAPPMVVYYVNAQVTATVCTTEELQYIDSKMINDFDDTLSSDNYASPDWTTSSGSSLRKLQTTAPNCDFCRTRYPKNLCNAMYNCKMRRQLRKADNNEDRKLGDDLATRLLEDCTKNIYDLSRRSNFSLSCRKAIGAATCHVEFL